MISVTFDQAADMTGQTLLINGGFMLHADFRTKVSAGCGSFAIAPQMGRTLMDTEAIRDIKQTSSWLTGLGALMILLGIAAIVEPLVATIAIVRILSWTLLAAGIVRVVHAIQSRRQPGFWPKLLAGVLYLIAGILLLSNLFDAKLGLTLAFGWVILAQGILEVIAAFQVRPAPNWGVMLSSGVVVLILGILILYRWPSNAIWVLGFFTGASFLCTGIWMIMLPWKLRHSLSNYHPD